jgi:predicted RNA-binding Zn-ribbon protein involved in translation (DUF1610 family)
MYEEQNRKSSTNGSQEGGRNMVATAIKGCIVLQEMPTKLGPMAIFKKKCEKCGYQEPAASVGVIDPKEKQYCTGFYCTHCGNEQLVVVRS